MNQNQFTIAIDIGSPKPSEKRAPKGKCGWYIDKETNGYIDTFQKQIENKTYFAIGIEAPIFIPVHSFCDFTAARSFDEKKRAWSAAAGAITTAIAIPFIDMCLRSIRNTSGDVIITTDYEFWKGKNDNCVLFWEAYISERAKPVKDVDIEEHIRDAKKAVDDFENGETIPLPKDQYIVIPEILAPRHGLKFENAEECGLIVK